MTIANFIKKRPYLIWWVKDYSKLGAVSIVEATLNYGDWDDVQTLIKMLGVKKVAKIFREKSKKSIVGRTNYRPDTIHYFTLYFNKHVPLDGRQSKYSDEAKVQAKSSPKNYNAQKRTSKLLDLLNEIDQLVHRLQDFLFSGTDEKIVWEIGRGLWKGK